MSQAKLGDTVRVHYTGKLNDGTEFDSSIKREPLRFQLGQGQVIPGFEKGILGMETGDKKTIVISPDQAYGQVREDLIATVKASDFPPNFSPQVGQQLQLDQPDGRKLHLTVANIENDKVTLDANHPLAGKTLTFDIELVDIAPTAEK